MRGPFPKRAVYYGRRSIVVLALLGLALTNLFLMPVNLIAEEHTSIEGLVLNGTSGSDAPDNLAVILHAINERGEVEVASSTTDNDGHFRFTDVSLDNDSTYAVTTSFQEVLYSTRVDTASLTGAVELTVFEVTGNLSDIHVGADVLMISGAKGDRRVFSVIEVVSLENEGDRTFVPDLDQPASMNFLRFSIPEGATQLEVASDVPGGQVLSVPTGFALTAPVTPGAHQVSYTYQVSYEGSQAQLTHSFPMGAEIFRVLVEDASGNLRAPDPLTSVLSTDVVEMSFEVWEAYELAPGTRMDMEIRDLPQPSLIRRVGDTLTDEPYLKIGLPGAVGLIAAVVLVYSLAYRRPKSAPATAAAVSVADDLANGGSLDTPQRGRGSQRSSIVEAIARLDDLFQRRGIVEGAYRRRRQELKATLLQMSLASQDE